MGECGGRVGGGIRAAIPLGSGWFGGGDFGRRRDWTPRGICAAGIPAQPFPGWEFSLCEPRVAPGSQPWAGWHSPFGIGPFARFWGFFGGPAQAGAANAAGPGDGLRSCWDRMAFFWEAGGVAALNPRLPAEIPPGFFGGWSVRPGLGAVLGGGRWEVGGVVSRPYRARGRRRPNPRLRAWAEELRTFGARERGVDEWWTVAGRYERRTRPLVWP